MDKLDDDGDRNNTVKFECERDWRRLKDVQAELQIMEPIALNTGPDGVVNNHNESQTSASLLQILHEHEKRLKAELQALQEGELKTLPENADFQLLILEQDQVKKLDHLKDTLIYSRAIHSEILEDIKKEEEAHSSLSSLNDALKKKIAAIEHVEASDERGRTLESVLTEMTSKVNKVTAMNKRLKDTLKDILSKHFPLPHRESIQDKSLSVDVNSMLSLRSIVGKLIEQSLNSPEQPYIDIDKTYWPPHIEFLLRCQIVIKDPQNSHRMKLVPFHL